MSHVDEGLLHAYIDGAYQAGAAERAEIEAHLAVCADCRVRLEDARRLRDVAEAALAAAAPAAAAPPAWESVVAEHGRRRAGATAPSGTPAGRRPPRLPLAWAATLILAVGAGWMARAMLVERGVGDFAPAGSIQPMLEQQEAVRDATAADADAGEAARQATVQQRPAEPPATASLESVAPSARRSDANVAPPAANLRDAGERREREAAAAPPATPTLAPLGMRAAAKALDEVALGRVSADMIAGNAQLANLARAVESVTGRWVAADSADVAAAFELAPLALPGQAPDTLQLARAQGRTIARSVYILDTGVVEVLQWTVDEAADLAEATGAGAAASRENESTVAIVQLRGIDALVNGTTTAAVSAVRAGLR